MVGAGRMHRGGIEGPQAMAAGHLEYPGTMTLACIPGYRRQRRRFVDEGHRRPAGSGWEMFRGTRTNPGAGGAHEFTGPTALLQRVIGFPGVDEFAVESRSDRAARLHADQASPPNRGCIGRFRLALEDSTDAIRAYG